MALTLLPFQPDSLAIRDMLVEGALGTVRGMRSLTLDSFIDNAAATEITIWPNGTTNLVFPGGAVAMQAVSNDPGDASPAGTGARTISVTGFDANFERQTETVVMNGVNPVPLVNTYIYVESITVLTAGTDDTNRGTVTVETSLTVDQCIIPPSTGRSIGAHIGCAADEQFVLTKVEALATGSLPAQIRWLWDVNLGLQFSSSLISSNTAGVFPPVDLSSPVVFPERSRVRFLANFPGGATNDVAIVVQGAYIDSDLLL